MPAVYAMLGNAAVAAVLALLALAVGRACRSPAVRHIVWVMVLLKLITPPLFRVPLAVLPASWADEEEVTGWQGNLVTGSGHCLPPTEQTNPIEQAALNKHYPSCLVTVSPSRLVILGRAALLVWIAGAAGWFFWQGRRIVRFRRRVAAAVDAGPEVAEAARCLARMLGIDFPPQVKAATGIGSPMLWGWGRNTVVLFPRELLARLSAEARDTLLAHELAHFLRRDHWVRMLEFVATGLYWWHPAVWLARTRIEEAEEECCDAWVVGGLAASPRRYAEALLATIDFVAELHGPCLPPGACPANRGARLLHYRLTRIAHAERPRALPGGIAARAAAVVLLFVHPILRAAPPKEIDWPSPAPVLAEAPLDSPSPMPPHSVPKSVEPPSWAVASAPDGAIAAIARDNEVVLRRPDGKVTALGPGKPLALAFAPNTQRLATAGPGSLVRTWDYAGNRLTEAHVPAAARGVAYTPDGTRLLVLDAAGGISVHDPNNLIVVGGWSVEGPANSIACSPDNRTVAVAFGSWLKAETGWVECWSITEQRKIYLPYSASAPVGAVRFAADGSTLVMGGWNGLLTWRALPNGELIAERTLPKGLVAAAAFSPDAGTLPLEPPPEPPLNDPALSPVWDQQLVRPLSPPRTASELLRGSRPLPQP